MFEQLALQILRLQMQFQMIRAQLKCSRSNAHGAEVCGRSWRSRQALAVVVKPLQTSIARHLQPVTGQTASRLFDRQLEKYPDCYFAGNRSYSRTAICPVTGQISTS